MESLPFPWAIKEPQNPSPSYLFESSGLYYSALNTLFSKSQFYATCLNLDMRPHIYYFLSPSFLPTSWSYILVLHLGTFLSPSSTSFRILLRAEQNLLCVYLSEVVFILPCIEFYIDIYFLSEYWRYSPIFWFPLFLFKTQLKRYWMLLWI